MNDVTEWKEWNKLSRDSKYEVYFNMTSDETNRILEQFDIDMQKLYQLINIIVGKTYVREKAI